MPSSVGKWAEEIGFYDDPEDDHVRLLVYGEMGSGKTTLAGTFPKPFFIDTDKGGLTLKEKKIPRIKLKAGNKTFDEIMDILHKIKTKEAPFDMEIETVVIDGFTALSNYLMIDILKYPKAVGKQSRDILKGKPEWDDYDCLKNEFLTIMKYIQDIGLNFVATCGVKMEKDEVKGTFVGQPNIIGGYRGIVGHDFNEVYYLEEKKGREKNEYIVHFQKFSYFATKSQLKKTGTLKNASYEELYL